jgi:hypothetical protein
VLCTVNNPGIIKQLHCCSGPGQRSPYSDSLRVGRSGDRIPVGARYSPPVQTGPGSHPASYTLGTGSIPGVKRQRRDVDHPPHLALMLKKEYSYTSIPPLGLRGLLQGELYLYLYLDLHCCMGQVWVFLFCFSFFREVIICWLCTWIFRLAHFPSPWRYVDE